MTPEQLKDIEEQADKEAAEKYPDQAMSTTTPSLSERLREMQERYVPLTDDVFVAQWELAEMLKQAEEQEARIAALERPVQGLTDEDTLNAFQRQLDEAHECLMSIKTDKVLLKAAVNVNLQNIAELVRGLAPADTTGLVEAGKKLVEATMRRAIDAARLAGNEAEDHLSAKQIEAIDAWTAALAAYNTHH